MTINKYIGSTKEEAISKAKDELGESIVIMNTKNRKPDGVFGIFKPSIWEVTVAVEEDTDGSVSLIKDVPLKTSTFSVKADENIDIFSTPVTPVVPSPAAPKNQSQPVPQTVLPTAKPKSQVDKEIEDNIKSAFREISLVVENAEEDGTLMTSPGSNVYKSRDKKEAIKEEKTNESKEEKKEPKVSESTAKRKVSNLPLVRALYNKLIDNEVDERYINKIFDDLGPILTSANSLDSLISNIYQKMVLKLGNPSVINTPLKGPLVVFFVGPTGVGKTTTIAKVASMFKLEQKKKVSFVTADTYRIAATEQLNVYANILDAPISIVYGPDELNNAIEGYKDQDLVLVDTVGFSHKNAEQKEGTKALIDALDTKYQKQAFLVLSVTTKYKDLKDIADTYKDICDYRLIFTKLDETSAYGNILNLRMYTGAELSYVTNGQSVPDDIETADPQKLVKAMLGG